MFFFLYHNNFPISSSFSALLISDTKFHQQEKEAIPERGLRWHRYSDGPAFFDGRAGGPRAHLRRRPREEALARPYEGLLRRRARRGDPGRQGGE